MDSPPVRVALGTAETRVASAALASAIGSAAGLRLVAHAMCVEDVLSACRSAAPGVLVLDQALSVPDPLEVLERVAGLEFAIQVVCLLQDELGASALARAVACGAAGFVMWESAVESIRDAVLAVVGGRQLVLSRELWPGVTPDRGPGAVAVMLSRRELEVLALSSRGRRTKEIAGDLGIGEETVETLLRRAGRKLGARTRTHAVAEAVRRGLV